MNTSGVTVLSGLENVMVMNSSGIVVDESNVVYINNIAYPFASTTGTVTVAPDYLKYPIFYEDFVGGGTESGEIGSNGWEVSAGTINYATANDVSWGVVRLTSGTSTLHYNVRTGDGVTLQQFQLQNISEVTISIRTADSTASDHLIFCGLAQRPDLYPDHPFFCIGKDNASSNWLFVTDDGTGSGTETDTGVALDTANWHIFRMKVEEASSTRVAMSCYYHLPGEAETLVAYHDTDNGDDLPSYTDTMKPSWSIYPTGGVARTLYVDFFEVKGNITR